MADEDEIPLNGDGEARPSDSQGSENIEPSSEEKVKEASVGFDPDDVVETVSEEIVNPVTRFAEENKIEKKDQSSFSVVAIEQEFEYFSIIANKVLSANLAPKGVNTVEKIIIILQTGRELGMPPMAALQNIHVIEGRATLGIHAITTLVKKAGIEFTTVKDYEPVYNKDQQVINYVTEIKFFRRSSLTGQILEETSRFSVKDAQLAGLLSKDNWKKYPKQMIWTRCFVLGSRRIASEALLGMYEMSELADVHDIKYEMADLKN